MLQRVSNCSIRVTWFRGRLCNASCKVVLKVLLVCNRLRLPTCFPPRHVKTQGMRTCDQLVTSNNLSPIFPVIFYPSGTVSCIEGRTASSASGTDDISAKFLKSTKMYSSNIVSSLFQRYLYQGVPSKDGKMGKVAPNHEAGDRVSSSN